MGQHRRLLTGGGLLVGGQIIGQACSFLRNIVVARLLTPEDFGIAATFGIAVSMFEMVSNLAVDRLLVQADDGDDPIFQGTAHLLLAIRGAIIALLLFALAWPFSRLFAIPQALWAFQCVALVPFLRGFVHLDYKRLQREFVFGKDVATEVIPQILLLVAAWPFVWWFEDYSAMVWLLVFQTFAAIVLSHLVARRSYIWACQRQMFKRMCVFGWPLLLDGILMFAVFQGDRLIIGTFYDMKILGIYSVAFSVTFVPSAMSARVTSALLLPLFSQAQNDASRFLRNYSLMICLLSLLCILIVAGFELFGEQIVVLTFGAKYADVGFFITWLAIAQMLRVLRSGVATACMSHGDTVTPLLANLGRASVYAAIIWAASAGGEIVYIVMLGAVGEFLGLSIGALCLHRYHGVKFWNTFKPVMVGFFVIGVAEAFLFPAHGEKLSLQCSLLAMSLVSITGLLGMAAFIGALRDLLLSFARRVERV